MFRCYPNIYAAELYYTLLLYKYTDLRETLALPVCGMPSDIRERWTQLMRVEYLLYRLMLNLLKPYVAHYPEGIDEQSEGPDFNTMREIESILEHYSKNLKRILFEKRNNQQSSTRCQRSVDQTQDSQSKGKEKEKEKEPSSTVWPVLTDEAIAHVEQRRSPRRERPVEHEFWQEQAKVKKEERKKRKVQERKAVVEKFEKEKESQQARERERRQQYHSGISALSSAERHNFEQYLREQGIWDKELFQAMLKPAQRQRLVTQEDLNRLFKKICSQLLQFLNFANLYQEEERQAFVNQLSFDLANNEHAYHAGDSTDLPTNYIIHRLGPLIWSGIIDINHIQPQSKDIRDYYMKYLLRLIGKTDSNVL